MHDIRFIRNNPDGFDKALARRRIDPALVLTAGRMKR